MNNSGSPNSQVKTFFKDSVSFLSATLVLVAGSYYLATIYFTEEINPLASLIYLFSAISFTVLTIASLFYVSHDAYKLCRRLRSLFLKVFVCFIILFNVIGYVGTIAISGANINQAAKLVSIPNEYRMPNLPPEVPTNMTWGQLAEFNIQTLDALRQCNIDKREILKRIEKK